MNDGPGLAAWDLARERTAQADAARSEELRRLCRLDRPTEEREAEKREHYRLAAIAREAKRRRKYAAELATVPHWPVWARPLFLVTEGHCAACGREIHRKNARHLCGPCQMRAGRLAPRMAVAVRLFRAEEWRP